MGGRTSCFDAKDREIDRSRRPFSISHQQRGGKKKAAAETRKRPKRAREPSRLFETRRRHLPVRFVSSSRREGKSPPRTREKSRRTDGRRIVVAAPRRRVTMDDSGLTHRRGTDRVRYGLGDVAHARRGTAAILVRFATSVISVTCGTTRHNRRAS